MSVEFASVTAALRGLLREGLAEDIALSSRPVDELLSQPAGRNTLNVLLLSASPLRSPAGLAPLGGRGQPLRPSPTYELLYLVTALGTEDLMAEVLLEHAARRFDETPVLTGQRAGLFLAADGGLLGKGRANWLEQGEPPAIRPFAADLPTWLSVWSTLRASWRLSAMYTVGPVALAPDEAADPRPPVLTRPA